MTGEHFLQPLYSIDDKLHINTAISLVSRGSLHFEPVHGLTATKFGIMTPLVIIPFYLAGAFLSSLFTLPEVLENGVVLQFVYLNGAFITALLIVFFYRFSRLLGYPRKTALYASFLLGLATVLCPYSKYISSAPLLALLTLLSWMAIIKWSRVKRRAQLAVAGVWFGLSLLTRLDNLSLIPLAWLAILWVGMSRQNGGKNKTASLLLRNFLPDAGIFTAPVILALGVHFLIEYLKYDGISSGYGGEAFTTNFLTGAFGLLLSAGHGLFLYSPPLVAALIFFPMFARRHKLAAFLALGTLVIRLFVFGKWWGWHGGACWGSRFLLPCLPLCCLALNEGLLRWKRLAGWMKATLWITFIAGVYVQLTGALVRPGVLSEIYYVMAGGNENQLNYIPNISGIFAAPDVIGMGMIDLWFLNWNAFFPVWPAVFIIGVLVLVMAFSLCFLIKIVSPKSRDFALLPEKSPLLLRRLLLIMLLLNVILFLLCHLGVNTNLIRGEEVYQYADGTKDVRTVASRKLAVDRRILEIPNDLEDVTMRWQGVMMLPLRGNYTFYMKARGGADFTLDGRRLIQTRLDEPQSTRGQNVTLEPGIHSFSLDYIPSDLQRPVIHVYATFPGFGVDRELLSNRYVFNSPPSGFHRAVIFIHNFKCLLPILSLLLFIVLYHTYPRKEPA